MLCNKGIAGVVAKVPSKNVTGGPHFVVITGQKSVGGVCVFTVADPSGKKVYETLKTSQVTSVFGIKN